MMKTSVHQGPATATLRSNASQVPSGDQDGAPSHTAFVVSWTRFEPSAFTSQISGKLPRWARLPENAIRLPSGDQAELSINPIPEFAPASGTTLEPSASISQSPGAE